jgi:GH25 family lysozyme M1 (1,4-beta-N-acetylmuramidase)
MKQGKALGRAGDGIKRYRPKRNVNRFINRLFYKEVKAFAPSALIIQQKQFPDLSFYQGPIKWDVMCNRTDAAIFRAGQNLWIDSMFLTNYGEAKERGMLRGAYWFYDDRVSPGAQAAKLIELIADDLPEMEIFIDWENSYGGSFGGLRNVVAMMQAVEKALPVRVGMYTGYYFFLEHSNAVLNWSQYQYLKDKPLWLGYYAVAEYVKIPPPWSMLTHWQYGTPVEDYGQISAEIDCNYFNGSITEFYSKYGEAGTLPEPEEPIMTRYEAVNLYDDMKLRQEHNTANTSNVMFPEGAKWHGDEIWIAPGDVYGIVAGINVRLNMAGDKWLRVLDVNGDATKTGWVAIVHLGRTYCSLTEINPPAPVDEITVSIEADIVATINGKPYHGVVMFDSIQLRPVE